MENLDAQLINRTYLESKAQESQASRLWDISKKYRQEMAAEEAKALREAEKLGEKYEVDEGLSSQEIKAMDLAQIQSLVGQRQAYDQALAERATKEKMSTASFYGALLVGLMKDGVDILGLGTVGWFFANLAFWAFILLNSSFRKILIRRLIGGKGLAYYIAILIELLPFVSIVPTYTVMVLLLKRKADKRVSALKSKQESNNREIARLSKRASAI